jgi:hypothetical protein
MSLVDGKKAVLPDILVSWLILVSAVIVRFDACKNSWDTMPLSPATNQVLCPQNTENSNASGKTRSQWASSSIFAFAAFTLR